MEVTSGPNCSFHERLRLSLLRAAGSGSFESTCQPEPTSVVADQPKCYHFRALDPRLPLRKAPNRADAFSWQAALLEGVRPEVAHAGAHQHLVPAGPARSSVRRR